MRIISFYFREMGDIRGLLQPNGISRTILRTEKTDGWYSSHPLRVP